jgi:hypothetical protein
LSSKVLFPKDYHPILPVEMVGWMLFEEKREKEKGCVFWVFQLPEVE